MATYVVFERADARQFAKLLLFLYDLPVRGIRVGGGTHVPDLGPPPNPPPREWPGWCTRAVPFLSRESNDGAATDEFAVRITQDLQNRWVEKRSQLTVQQRTFVQDHFDIARDLDLEDGWKRTVLLPDGTVTRRLVENDDIEPSP